MAIHTVFAHKARGTSLASSTIGGRFSSSRAIGTGCGSPSIDANYDDAVEENFVCSSQVPHECVCARGDGELHCVVTTPNVHASHWHAIHEEVEEIFIGICASHCQGLIREVDRPILAEEGGVSKLGSGAILLLFATSKGIILMEDPSTVANEILGPTVPVFVVHLLDGLLAFRAAFAAQRLRARGCREVVTSATWHAPCSVIVHSRLARLTPHSCLAWG
mmetsp:Transcript_993/g.1881  ORF Transcript_993/g.1881 Transcript_993/m.1881 type:complete len:220 (-) Transcript_993:1098-1757(-)